MKNRYYVTKTSFGVYELRQTRFKGTKHPHDVCAVGTSQDQLKNIYAMYLSGGVDWLEEKED